MNTIRYPLFAGPLSKEQQAMEELHRRVNCNDRREQPREAEEYARKARQLAAVTFLGAVL
ncbi:hypothetical protein [Streptomyces longispororuber]|uniref:hypothetical protein n=1 Tax=Streptomyces longispororuber TaxID=68230 RepID=UPI00210BF8AB|nr:hypothetical protein [Streptomyces longispororuber]MCQ4207967.1 hypothetical protein [Streptomyces longispororuber]